MNEELEQRPGESEEENGTTPEETSGEDLAELETPGKLKQTFVNRFGHIRAGWRMMIYVIITALLSFPAKYLHGFFKPYFSGEGGFHSPIMIVQYIILTSVFMLSAFIVLKWIDKRPFKTLGLWFSPGWFKEFSIGLGIGFGLLTTLFLIFWLTGLVEVTAGARGIELGITLLSFLILFALAGLLDELMLRGYLFQAFIEGSNALVAVVVLSLIFSIMHMFNPNFSAGGALNIFLAGVMLSVAYIKTRSLWLPTGLHMAWNWTQGPLWGMNVSGIDIQNSFMVSVPQGPELLSGGEFGAEGSLISSVVIILVIWYMWRASWLKPSEANSALWRKYPAAYGVPPAETEN
ncbi:MAG: CPBP family intramembrane metalloprotease [Candidatus Marinimicrobia bacterium]|nr:CPBP family intramembrane metalloprotease [Candidatus Neomarinimicrobiota bacterium]